MTACSLVLLATLAAPPSDATSEAKQLVRRSIVEYNGGDFEKALADVKRAYDLEPAPGLLYNLGQCHRALHHWEQAEFFFQGYLREKPNAPNRVAVRALVEQMEKNRLDELAERKASPPPEVVAPSAATPPPAPATQPAVAQPSASPPPVVAEPPGTAPQPIPPAAVEAPPPTRHIPASAWALGGIGIAVGIAGGVLWALAQSDRSGYASAGLEPPSVKYSTIAQSNTFALTGDVLVPVGSVLLAIGIGIAVF